MGIPETTPIRILYTGQGQTPVELGTGHIDPRGFITVLAPAPGQADYLAEMMGELNARDHVVLKGPPVRSASKVPPPTEAASTGEPDDLILPAPEPDPQPHPPPSRQKVPRGSPGFLAALKDYGRRVYAMQLEFDEGAFGMDRLFGPDSDLPPPRPPRARKHS